MTLAVPPSRRQHASPARTTKSRALDLLAIAHAELERTTLAARNAEDHRAYCASLALDTGATYNEIAAVIGAASNGTVTNLLARWRKRTGQRKRRKVPR